MEKKIFLLPTILIFVTVATPVFAQGEEAAEVNFGILSLLPPLLAIILAFITRQVIVSLFLGLFVGVTMLNGWNPFQGFLHSLDTYIIKAVADPWHAGILVFTLTIGGMVAIIEKMGGMKAVADALSKLAGNARGSQIVTELVGILVFFDDYANSLVVGPTMRPLNDKMRVSREKLAFLVDATAAPVSDVAFISTWIGYEVGLINDSFNSLGIKANAYLTFLSSIPYRFYGLFMLLFVFLVAYLMRDFGPMYRAEVRARTTGRVISENAKPMMNVEETGDFKVKPRIYNAVIPILTLVVVGFWGLWYSGGGAGLPLTAEGIREALGNADASIALLWAAVSATGIAIIMGLFQGIFTIGEAFDTFVEGAKSLLITAIILTLAWSLGAVTKDIKTADYLISALSGNLSPGLVPFLVFLISCLISFSTGTSWGTMAISMPLALPLAHGLGAPLLPTLGSVMAGAVFGDHCSPISDTTILSSMASACDHMDHVTTQMPYAVSVALISAVFGYIPVGLGLNVWIALLLGAVVTYLVVRFVGKSTNPEDLKLDIKE
ncbi:Na+/H+ antiporter NhaC family protein [Calorimonas adulescens]|uniref:Na+/H+ antiporter NhaC family protein n=1 Tax=Calorimonas adulescens TaxID=2606906 RepID=A0A5D8QF47_9THEO|nr:Na+/H+ antiporter NhaC family protein [Calorimonas adulescens]TZE83121.1 Na+/H+ antiporter NhaC family protein [Calorimonas adulescens]